MHINYIIDIDGTICGDIQNEAGLEAVLNAVPFIDARERINKWFNEGNTITFFTARTEEMRAATEKWLLENGFKYHNLIMNKPRGGDYFYIDNAKIQSMQVREGYWRFWNYWK